MKGSTEPKIHPQWGKEFIPKLTDKSQISVRDYHLGHSMQPKYVVHEQPGVLGRGYFFGTWYHMGHLGETVYENSNCGLAIRLR